MFQKQYFILYDIIMLHMPRLSSFVTLLTISDKYINKSDCRFRKDNVFMEIFVNLNRSEKKQCSVELYNNFSHNIKKVLLFLIYPNIFQQFDT